MPPQVLSCTSRNVLPASLSFHLSESQDPGAVSRAWRTLVNSQFNLHQEIDLSELGDLKRKTEDDGSIEIS